jgi:transposase
MSHIAGASRDQQVLFPEVLDDYIAEENPVRFIDAVVDSLDLDALGFRRVQPAATGRPAYHPGDLLKLYIYGYMHRIRSSRRLEQETQRNVDAQHKLIGEQHVTNAVTDADQLSAMARTAKEALGVEHLKVVADMGSYHGEAIKACEEAGLEPSIAKPLTSANRKLGLYGKERFTYDLAHDCYRCPAAQTLTCRFTTVELGRQIRYYATTACRTCAINVHCTRNKEGRRMTRWVHEHILEQMQKRIEANPGLMKKRKQVIEHPCGTSKHWNDQGYFLMRGLEKVSAEMSLSALAYNLKRVLHTLGVPTMIAAVA